MDEIIITDYNPNWVLLFEQEAVSIRAVLDRVLITRIEHFGSTAVPGLAAKPIIDSLVGARSLAEAKQCFETTCASIQTKPHVMHN